MFYNFTTVKHQHESGKLPTTKMAFDQRVLQAHYTALTWKSAHIPSPILPDPQEYGWTLNKITNLCHPIMTKNLPVSDTVVERSLCRCKTGCTQRRCICKKNNLLCTEIVKLILKFTDRKEFSISMQYIIKIVFKI